jgi:hypothetical protein
MKLKPNLEDIFEEKEPEEKNLPAVPVSHGVQETSELSKDETQKDLRFVRENLVHLSEKASQLAEVSLESLSDEATPRQIEAASLAFKTAAEISEKLLLLHKSEKQTAAVQILNTEGTINLSSAELLKELKNG